MPALFDVKLSTRNARLPLEHDPSQSGDGGETEERQRNQIHQQVNRISAMIAISSAATPLTTMRAARADPRNLPRLMLIERSRSRPYRRRHSLVLLIDGWWNALSARCGEQK